MLQGRPGDRQLFSGGGGVLVVVARCYVVMRAVSQVALVRVLAAREAVRPAI